MDDWGLNIETVADALLGKPTSRNTKELRYGSRGSLRVNLETGFFDDYESGESGGTLALIKRERGLEPKDAIEWMRNDLRIDVGDRQPQQTSRAARAPDREPDRKPDPKPEQKVKPKLVKAYDYTSEAGELLFQVCRMEPKNFLQRRRPRSDDDPSDIRNGWVWKRDGVTQVPYRLTELIEAIADERTVFIVEGEKDVDNLAEQGIVATCNAGGAGKWPDELTPFFAGADVVILPDNDPQARNPKTNELRFHPNGEPVLPGQDHARMVAEKIRRIAKTVRICALPNLPEKGDVSDWLAAGGTSAALFAASKASPLFQPQRFASKFGAVVWGDPRTTRTPYQYLIKGLIPRKESVLIYGASSSGKSFFTHDIAMAIARGGTYCGRKVRQGLVIYCAAEAGFGFIDRRMPGYAVGNSINAEDFLPFVVLPRKFDLFSDEKALIELIAEIKAIVAMIKMRCRELGIEEVELEAVVLDTLNKVTPAMDEINGKEVGLVMTRLDRIREECDTGLWLVHHKNANGDRPRGHTSLYAAFETAIEINRTGEMFLYNKNKKIYREKRTMKVAKQREGDDTGLYEFCLKGVKMGLDEDGDDITSCVIDWIGDSIDQGGKVKSPSVQQVIDLKMTAQNRTIYQALRRAIADKGVPAPAALGLPKQINRVVHKNFWGEVYRENFAQDDSDDAVRKALQRANNWLITNGFIARSNPWVWDTGKRPKGEAAQPATEDDTPPETESPAAAPSQFSPEEEEEDFTLESSNVVSLSGEPYAGAPVE